MLKSRLPLLAMAACLVAGYVLAQEIQPATEEAKGPVRHVVLFKFKAEATPEQIREVEQAFVALTDKIDEIKDLEWGTDESPEGISKGFTHCFLVTFASAADRDAYLPHPEHQAFVDVLRPHLQEALVVDYVPR